MSIKHGLLALLERGPSHGYQLRADFDAATGAAWPLNVGQVYTTLDRLERDGLVAQDGDPDAEGRIAYRITDDGRRELTSWFRSPVSAKSAPRDELRSSSRWRSLLQASTSCASCRPSAPPR